MVIHRQWVRRRWRQKKTYFIPLVSKVHSNKKRERRRKRENAQHKRILDKAPFRKDLVSTLTRHSGGSFDPTLSSGTSTGTECVAEAPAAAGF